MHFSPGAPILRSYDLVNWQFVGHSVPALSPYFGPQYALPPGSNGYIGGVWASWLIFVPSQQKWFWGGCVKSVFMCIWRTRDLTSPCFVPISFYESHVFSSANADPASSWSQIATVDGCQVRCCWTCPVKITETCAVRLWSFPRHRRHGLRVFQESDRRHHPVRLVSYHSDIILTQHHSIAQMSTDMKTVVKQALVFTLPSDKSALVFGPALFL
jgi:hypothetical protein